MQSLDNLFFEKYKKLDKLCSEIYSCQNGITEYISIMKNKYDIGKKLILSWNSDYKMLNRIRFIRNRLAHDTISYKTAEISDIDFINDFYDRIISVQDPLSLLRKASTQSKAPYVTIKTNIPKTDVIHIAKKQTDIQNKSNDKLYNWVIFFLTVGLIALIMLFYVVYNYFYI